MPITPPSAENLEALSEYVRECWPKLTRTHEDLFFGALNDSKMSPGNGERILYISPKESLERVETEINDARENVLAQVRSGEIKGMNEADVPVVQVRRLPERGSGETIDNRSLLYLPKPYIVPGGRFNEMYNWDTAFVVRGLLDSGNHEMAKNLVDNMLYEVEHYGTILNGNRAYYMDFSEDGKHRSQPPLISAKVLRVFDAYNELGHPVPDSGVEWLKNATRLCEAYYQHWITPPHLHEESGLSMYRSTHDTANAEVAFGEHDHYKKAYDQLVAMWKQQQALAPEAELGYRDRKDRYYIEQFLDVSEEGQPLGLSKQFYMGDWAMRESGFDPSRRFGFFNVDVINYLPVCINSLRYKMEEEISEMYTRLAEHEPNDPSWAERADYWNTVSHRTKHSIREHLWDKGERGENDEWLRPPAFRDFNINQSLCEKYDLPQFRDYPFATALFPMWIGIATEKEAQSIHDHILPDLKTEFGLMTSTFESKSQWDAPFIWAPLQVVAVEALEKYGYYDDALDIASGFLNVLAADLQRHAPPVLHEKYEGREGTSNTAALVENGYSENAEGFAWTNAAAIELIRAQERLQGKIAQQERAIIHLPERIKQILDRGKTDPRAESKEPVNLRTK